MTSCIVRHCTKENPEIIRKELTSFSVLLKVHVELRAKIARTSLSLQPLPVVFLVVFCCSCCRRCCRCCVAVDVTAAVVVAAAATAVRLCRCITFLISFFLFLSFFLSSFFHPPSVNCLQMIVPVLCLLFCFPLSILTFDPSFFVVVVLFVLFLLF